MDYCIRFANWHWIYFLLPVLILFILYKLFYYKPITVKHSLVVFLKTQNVKAPKYKRNILFLLQIIIAVLLILLCLKPQLVDKNSKITVEGIDIILDLDVSGSMESFDELNNPKPRIDIAKEEAIKFINKRENDQVGVVLFAAHAVTLCPLTLDKNILTQLIGDLELGFIDPNGTSLCISLVAACNRLKNSKSKNKIIILLTDGAPSPGDLPVQTAIDMAKKLGIKIYAVGIGSEQGGYIKSHFGMVMRNPGFKINKIILKQIAEETGGKFFLARSESDMKNIYKTIDKLEKTKQETEIYSNYFDLHFPVAMLIFSFLSFYILLTTFIWFGI